MRRDSTVAAAPPRRRRPSTAKSRRASAVSLRGYRLHTLTTDWASTTSPTMWLAEPPLDLWEQTIRRPNVRAATLIQSGRVMRHYKLDRTPDLPLDNDERSSSHHVVITVLVDVERTSPSEGHEPTSHRERSISHG